MLAGRLTPALHVALALALALALGLHLALALALAVGGISQACTVHNDVHNKLGLSCKRLRSQS